MIRSPDRRHAVELIEQARQSGARLAPAGAEVGLDVRTYQRRIGGGKLAEDGRPGAVRPVPATKLRAEEQAPVLAVCHQPD